MATPFLAEIKVVSFNFPPKGWAFCNGQLLPINQNQALFSLLGTTYGGNGQTTFGLPNLQGKIAMHLGGGFTLGQTAGEVNHTLTQSEMPSHVHLIPGSSVAGNVATPVTNYPGSANTNPYSSVAPNVGLPGTTTSAGGSQAHNNLAPYLVLNYIIALSGIFPSQN